MNETKLVIFGLVVLVFAAILLWVLEEPEILVDKEIEITIALGVGLLILILDRRADRRIHEMIHEQHLLINKMHKMIDEQNELIKIYKKYPHQVIAAARRASRIKAIFIFHLIMGLWIILFVLYCCRVINIIIIFHKRLTFEVKENYNLTH